MDNVPSFPQSSLPELPQDKAKVPQDVVKEGCIQFSSGLTIAVKVHVPSDIPESQQNQELDSKVRVVFDALQGSESELKSKSQSGDQTSLAEHLDIDFDAKNNTITCVSETGADVSELVTKINKLMNTGGKRSGEERIVGERLGYARGKRSTSEKLDYQGKMAEEQHKNIEQKFIDQRKKSPGKPIHLPTDEEKKTFAKRQNVLQSEAFNNPTGKMTAGAAATQGRRPEMEDEHIAMSLSFDVKGVQHEAQFLGVFDGHSTESGGDKVAKFVKKNLPGMLKEEVEKKKGIDSINETTICDAMHDVCLYMADRLWKQPEASNAGTTAAFTVVVNNDIYTANVGDSRVICVDSQGQTRQLSEDAKPTEARFKKGIVERGAPVVLGRIGGSLSVGRSIGDQAELVLDEELERSAVMPIPKITRIAIPADGCYLCHACDGLWDVASSNQVGQLIHEMAQQRLTPQQMAENLTIVAWTQGSKDNISVVVTKIPGSQTNP